MKNWILLVIAGAISLVAGVMALLNPFAASLTVELLAGWSFVLVGLITVFSAFGDQGWGARIFMLLLGVLILLLGINMLAHPLRGLLSLTYAAAMIMMIAGIFRLIIAFKIDLPQFRWILGLSGLLSIALALMIFTNFPQSAAIVLGVYLAIELISNGVSLIAISLARKSAIKDSV